MALEYLKFFSIGLLDGILSGLLGIGGGVLILPILLYTTNIEVRVATAISAIQVFFASSFGTLFNWLQKTINFKYALIFGIPSAITYFLGSYFTKFIPKNIIIIIYLCAAILALVLFFIKRGKNKHNNNLELSAIRVPKKKDYLKIIPISLFTGFAFGVLGVGGGFLYVPLLVLLFDLPIRVAIGTSLMIVFSNAVPGIVGKLLSIRFNIFIGLAVALGAIAGAKIGTYINKKVGNKLIRVIFIILLSIIIIRVILDIFIF